MSFCRTWAIRECLPAWEVSNHLFFVSEEADVRPPGLILSTGERAGSELSVYGPEGVDHFLASMRYHTRR